MSSLELQSSPRYNVSVAQIRVGTNIIDSEFAALFDTGTSFTYLEDPPYTKLTESVTIHILNLYSQD